MDIVKVRELSDTELETALREAKQDLWQARFALSTRQLKDYSTIPQTRRTIARILTVQRERPKLARRRREGDHAMTGATPQVQNKRKTKVGRVVSDKMDKTIVVSVERLARHPLYKRVIRLTTKFKAHDEENDAHTGDTVLIEESRPLSATKRWRLVKVVARAGEHGNPARHHGRRGRDVRGDPRRRPSRAAHARRTSADAADGRRERRPRPTGEAPA